MRLHARLYCFFFVVKIKIEQNAMVTRAIFTRIIHAVACDGIN